MNQDQERKMESIVLEKIRDSHSIRSYTVSYGEVKIALMTGFFSEEELEIMLEDTRKLKEIIRKNIENIEPVGGNGDEPQIYLEFIPGLTDRAHLILCIGGDNCRWRWR